jgi:ABC-type transporter MlaC component
MYLKFVLMAALSGFASSAIAGSPQAQLQDTMDRVLALTQTFNSENDFAENKSRLREIIFPRFDFAEMARRSLGNRWSSLAGKQVEFIAAFMQFAESSYLTALGSYRGEK